MKQRLRVLVTGASGFIGRFVAAMLISDGRFELVVVGRRRPANLEERLYTFFKINDIHGDTDWMECLRGVDAVLHLAGIAHVSGSLVSMADAFQEINVRGTVRLACQALEADVRQFIFLSSIGVNGNANVQPFSVGNKPSPKEAYAVSKLQAEDQLKSLCAGTSMAYTIVRPPLVYGPNAPGNFGLLSAIVSKGIPLPLADIPNSRSFVSVWNLSDMLLQCLVKERAHGETFLIKDGTDVSTSEFLKLIGEASGQNVRLFRVPLPLLKLCARLIGRRGMYDKLVDSLLVEDSHTRKALGWQPPYTLQESLGMCFQNDSSD